MPNPPVEKRAPRDCTVCKKTYIEPCDGLDPNCGNKAFAEQQAAAEKKAAAEPK